MYDPWLFPDRLVPEPESGNHMTSAVSVQSKQNSNVLFVAISMSYGSFSGAECSEPTKLWEKWENKKTL